jgi:hypothetical protein
MFTNNNDGSEEMGQFFFERGDDIMGEKYECVFRSDGNQAFQEFLRENPKKAFIYDQKTKNYYLNQNFMLINAKESMNIFLVLGTK